MIAAAGPSGPVSSVEYSRCISAPTRPSRTTGSKDSSVSSHEVPGTPVNSMIGMSDTASPRGSAGQGFVDGRDGGGTGDQAHRGLVGPGVAGRGGVGQDLHPVAEVVRLTRGRENDEIG